MINLNENELEKINVSGHQSIKILEARKNKLTNCEGFFNNCSNLMELYLAEN